MFKPIQTLSFIFILAATAVSGVGNTGAAFAVERITVTSNQRQPSPFAIKAKADKAVIRLKEAVKAGRDVAQVVPKMKRVKTLGDAGKLGEVDALLDEIHRDFDALEAGRPLPSGAVPTETMPSDAMPSKGGRFADDRVVKIHRYDGDAMEVFISRDGKHMFFNSMKTVTASKDLYYAERLDDYNFLFKGEITPLNTPAVEGVPTMDRDGNFYYISTAYYTPGNLVTMYQGTFKDGNVTGVKPLGDLSLHKGGWLNMDSEISDDGETMYSTQSYFERGNSFPSKSYFFTAKKTGQGFEPQKNSARIFKTINRDKIVYGASISKDELEIFYTRLLVDERKFESLVATRPHKNAPFGEPKVISAITGFSEAPALNEREDMIYYHKKSGPTGKFQIHALHRQGLKMPKVPLDRGHRTTGQ